MDRKTKRKLRQYYRNISAALICDHKEKKQILSAIKSSVECYLADNPQAGIEEVVEHFGTAAQVAAEYCSNESPDALIAKVRFGRLIVRIVLIAVAVALLVYIIAIVSMVVADIIASSGYSVITIEEEETINNLIFRIGM